MLGYLGYVNLTDGQHSVRIEKVSEVIIKSRGGKTTRVKIGLHPTRSRYYGSNGKVTAIKGHRTTKGRSLLEEQTYGKCYYKKDQVMIPYRKTSWTGVDGWIWRRDNIGRDTGIAHTRFCNGSFREQYFNYSNGQRAYRFKKGDNELKIKYPNGSPRLDFVGSKAIHDRNSALQYGYALTKPFDRNRSNVDENCEYVEYDRRGIIKNQVSLRNRQINGDYIKNGVKYFYVNGLAVPKALYEARPEQIDPRKVLRIENAQVRAMMLKKVGLARLVEVCKGKVVDQDDKGSILYDFPVACEDKEAEDIDKFERVLKVVCPSTKGDYFLRIPCDEHFNTCEKARQGTFTGFDIEAKPVQFAVET